MAGGLRARGARHGAVPEPVGGAPRGAPPGPWSPRSIRFRIAAAFVAALVAIVGPPIALVGEQAEVRDGLRLVADGYLPLAEQVARLRRDQERVVRDLRRLEAGGARPVGAEVVVSEIYTRDVKDNLQIARVYVEGLRSRELPPAEQAVLAKLLAYLTSLDELFGRYDATSAAYQRLRAKLAEGAPPLPEEDRAEVEAQAEVFRGALRDVSKQLGESFDKLDRALDARIADLATATERRQSRAAAVALALAAGGAFVGLALLGAAFYALSPIGRLTAEVQRVAAGERGARVEVGGDDEVGLLAREFNAMAQAIELRDARLTERAGELDRLSTYLASVVDGLEDGLVVVEEGVVTLSNPAARRVWGVETGAAVPELLRPAVLPGRAELAGPEGRPHTVRSVPFGGGEGVVVVLADISGLVDAQARAARSERLAVVGQMLAQIVHEVRNPLNALSLNTELLADELGELDPERRSEGWALLDTIASEAERLTEVTAHYLQLARRPPARPTAVDLAQGIHEVVRLLEAEVAAAGAVLRAELADAPVGLQWVDGGQIRQALLNIVRNALEAGGRTLVLSLEAVRGDAGREVHIVLQDDGPGLPPDVAARATDPFFSTKAQGTGLGLAITRQILEDHGGRIHLESGEGGTRVALILPWRPAERAEG